MVSVECSVAFVVVLMDFVVFFFGVVVLMVHVIELVVLEVFVAEHVMIAHPIAVAVVKVVFSGEIVAEFVIVCVVQSEVGFVALEILYQSV